MRSQDFAHLYDLEDTFWWFSGMRAITAALLDPFLNDARSSLSVLDAGCGTGGMLAWLSRYSRNGNVTGIDISPEAINFCRARGLERLALASATQLPFAASSFDLVTSFDVLVQFREDEADVMTLDEIFRVLRPGGLAFVRVAAYSWMRSSHDEQLCGYRRYTRRQLSTMMEAAGFRVLRSTYANTLLLPLAIIRRLVLPPLGLGARGSDVKPLPDPLDWLNGLLCGILKGESSFVKHVGNLPFGLSVICLARKPIDA